MRILFCTDSWPPQLNGVSVVTAAMASGLQSRGWDCHVVAPEYPAQVKTALQSPPEVMVHPLPSAAWPPYPDVRFAYSGLSRVRRILRDFKPDVVHCATEFIVGRLGASAARRAGIPLCTSYHTDFGKYTTAYGIPWMRRPVQSWIAHFHRQAQRTLTPSHTARDDLRRMGVTADVWGRAVDTDAFHPRHYSPLTRYQLAYGQAFTFLYVGRLAPEKNVELLLSAFAMVRDALPEGAVRLAIAGSGPSEDSLRARAGAGVLFLGAVDREKVLPAVYASSDAFVYASLTETLGLVVLEAMASGLPVIATPAGGVADHLQHARNGLAYDAGDVHACAEAMRRVLRDASLHEALRAGARRTAESQSWERELDRLDGLFRAMLVKASATSGTSVPSSVEKPIVHAEWVPSL